MTSANDRQVGGSHYKNPDGFEHWDLIVASGMGLKYLSSTATKYIARWRKKGGLQDLQKALHYIDKAIENKDYFEFDYSFVSRLPNDTFLKFQKANDLNGLELGAIIALTPPSSPKDLNIAKGFVLKLIETAEAKPVPLTDSNKHAERTDAKDPTGW